MTGVEAMAAAFEAMTDNQRAAERQRIDDELARRRRVLRVKAMNGAAEVAALIDRAELLADLRTKSPVGSRAESTSVSTRFRSARFATQRIRSNGTNNARVSRISTGFLARHSGILSALRCSGHTRIRVTLTQAGVQVAGFPLAQD